MTTTCHLFVQQSRAIVNMASIHDTVGTGQGASAYTAAKHGVVGLSKQTGIEYG